MTNNERLELAHKVYDVVFMNVESFREDNIGADLAYLMGAIVDLANPDDSFVDWSYEGYGETPVPILEILRENFPAIHVVWMFIKL